MIFFVSHFGQDKIGSHWTCSHLIHFLWHFFKKLFLLLLPLLRFLCFGLALVSCCFSISASLLFACAGSTNNDAHAPFSERPPTNRAPRSTTTHAHRPPPTYCYVFLFIFCNCFALRYFPQDK